MKQHVYNPSYMESVNKRMEFQVGLLKSETLSQKQWPTGVIRRIVVQGQPK
jgi:hypothetical protein